MKITKSQLRKIIREEIQKEAFGGQSDPTQSAEASPQDLLTQAQDLYHKLTTEGFSDASRAEVTAIFNELQNAREKHFKEKGRDAEYDTLTKIKDAINEMSKAVRYENYSILARAQGMPAEPHLSWLMSQ